MHGRDQHRFCQFCFFPMKSELEGQENPNTHNIQSSALQGASTSRPESIHTFEEDAYRHLALSPLALIAVERHNREQLVGASYMSGVGKHTS